MYYGNLSETTVAILSALAIFAAAIFIGWVRYAQIQGCHEFCAPQRGRMIYPEGQSSYCMCEVPGVVKPY